MSPQYLAGFFDGEGCIRLYWKLHSKHPGGSWTRKVEVKSAYLPTLLELKRLYSGSLYTEKRREPQHKQTYTWSIGSRASIQRFLTDTLPYLQEKKAQAQQMLAAMEGNLSEAHASEQLTLLKHVEFNYAGSLTSL